MVYLANDVIGDELRYDIKRSADALERIAAALEAVMVRGEGSHEAPVTASCVNPSYGIDKDAFADWIVNYQAGVNCCGYHD